MQNDSEHDNQRHLSTKLREALATLLEAFNYAVDTNSSPWDFAVPIRCLRKPGVNETDLRWLVRKRFVEHAREVTLPGNNGRDFQPIGDLTFSRRTCFILTEIGVAEARRIRENQDVRNEPPDTSGESRPGNGHIAESAVVYWDPESRRLSVNGRVAKRFKWSAANQETVLNAFQEEGWPSRIDDPLPPQPEQNSKRRLSDTIKCLNRRQTNHLIHFHGDGTGEGIIWEIVEPIS